MALGAPKILRELPAFMTPPSPKRTPALDEASFQKLLEAAFVLQQHNERQGGNAAQPDFNATLAAIVETHKLIQSGQFDFQTAISLIADLAQKTTHAAGVAIGMVDGGELVYRATSGNALADAGSVEPLASCASADCFVRGKLLQCADASTTISPPPETWTLRNIQALIAAPVYQRGKIIGVLELRFARPHSFETKDVGTAQLMAGLVSEAMLYSCRAEPGGLARPDLGRSTEDVLGLEDDLEQEIRPPEGKSLSSRQISSIPGVARPEPSSQSLPADIFSKSTESIAASPPATCATCGHTLDEGEAFCGQCGTPRPGSGFSIQSKWASLWQMQQAGAKGDVPASRKGPQPSHAVPDSPASSPRETANQTAPAEADHEFEKMTEVAAEPRSAKTWQPTSQVREHPESEPVHLQAEQGVSPAPLQAPSSSLSPPSEFSAPPAHAETEAVVNRAGDSLAPASPIRIIPDEEISVTETPVSPWASAQQARSWLDAAKGQKHALTPLSDWWKRHRANVYVGMAAVILSISVVMFVVSLGRTPVTPSSPVANAHHRKTPPPPNLTLFEKFLVGIGLAEPPEAPVYLGNPNTQVWVDVHTALYYCPGSELYGKTQGGKFTTQRDAQQDQFEPANRKVCD